MRKRTNSASLVGRPNVVLALILGVHEQDGEERNLLDHDSHSRRSAAIV